MATRKAQSTAPAPASLPMAGSVNTEEAIIATPITDADITYGGGLFAQNTPIRAILGECDLRPWDWTASNSIGKNSKIEEKRKNNFTGQMEDKEWTCALRIPFLSVETGEVFHTEYMEVGPLSKFWPCNGTSPYDIEIPHVRGGKGVGSNHLEMMGLNEEQMGRYAGPVLAQVPKAQRYFTSGSLVFALSLEEAGCPPEIARTTDFRKWKELEVTVLQLPVKDQSGKNVQTKKTVKLEGGVEKIVEQDKLVLQATDYYPARKGAAGKKAQATAAMTPAPVQAPTHVPAPVPTPASPTAASTSSVLPQDEAGRFAYVGNTLMEMLLGAMSDANPKAVTPKSGVINRFREIFPGDVASQNRIVATLSNAAFLEQLPGIVYDEGKFTFELE